MVVERWRLREGALRWRVEYAAPEVEKFSELPADCPLGQAIADFQSGYLEACSTCAYHDACHARTLSRKTRRDVRGGLPLCECGTCKHAAEQVLSQDELAYKIARCVGKFGAAVLAQAVKDLLPPDVKDQPAPSGVKTGIARLASLPPDQHAEERVAMRDAYLWFKSDDRRILRLARTQRGDFVRSTEGDWLVVEVCIPFLVACEADGMDPAALREKVFGKLLPEWGLTPRIVLHPEVPLLGGEPAEKPTPKPKKPKKPTGLSFAKFRFQ